MRRYRIVDYRSYSLLVKITDEFITVIRLNDILMPDVRGTVSGLRQNDLLIIKFFRISNNLFCSNMPSKKVSN